MATQTGRVDSDVPSSDTCPVKALVKESIRHDKLTYVTETWVGYERHGKRYIDKIALPDPADMRLEALKAYWQSLTPQWDPTLQRTILCKRPFVSIASMPMVSHAKVFLLPIAVIDSVSQAFTNNTAAQYFPHETQFTSLERSDILTRGFLGSVFACGRC